MKYVFVSLLVMTACRPVARLGSDIPEQVDRVALLMFADDNALLSASPLVLFDPDVGVPVERAAEGRAVLVGYDESRLEADDEALLRPLRVADTCDVELPAPDWSIEWGDGDSVAAFTAPPLAFQPPPACEAIDSESVRVEAQCLERRCPATILSIDGCEATLDLRTCGLGQPRSRLDDTELYCVLDRGPFQPRCGYTLHGPRRSFDLDVARMSPHEDPPALYTGENLNTPTKLVTGWISDIAVVDSVVHVVTNFESDGRACRTGYAVRELVTVDAASMNVVRRSPVSGCTDAIVRDPIGTGYLAGTLRDGRWYVSRHAADTTMLAEQGVDVPAAADLNGQEIVALPEIDRVAILVTAQFVAVDRSFLLLFELSSLMPIDTIELDMRAFAMTVESESLVALTHGDTFFVTRRDLRDGHEVGRIDVQPSHDFGRSLFGVHADARGLFAVGYDAVFSYQPTTERVRIARDYASSAWAYVLAPDPSGDGLLVLGTEQNDRRDTLDAVAYRYDPVEARVLPDVTTVGTGIVSRAREAADGTLWIAMPWSAELGRIRAVR